ncbi:MAG: hypothetical protein QOK37_1580 [Thermoanaerobaculia bacterium]|jgi:hypothetical protein|nr:hypothetical protein [Thermoanaerobaculia bacterium]
MQSKLTAIAKPIVEGEFGVTALWSIVGSQTNNEWHVHILRDPLVEFVVDHGKSDDEIADQIRRELRKRLR